jgi:hypothetical protein
MMRHFQAVHEKAIFSSSDDEPAKPGDNGRGFPALRRTSIAGISA